MGMSKYELTEIILTTVVRILMVIGVTCILLVIDDWYTQSQLNTMSQFWQDNHHFTQTSLWSILIVLTLGD